jgi:hypothetical protein
MEEAKGEASDTTVGVNAIDMQDAARVALFRRRYTRESMLAGKAYQNPDGKSYSYRKMGLRLANKF